MPGSIRLSLDDGIARLTFARPDRLNAFDFAMGSEYRDACLAAVADPGTRAILVSAEGRAFCAGGDVLAMAQSGADQDGITAAAHQIHAGIAALVEAPIPVVAAAQGAVAGGGIGLLLAADYVVAGEDLRVAGRYAGVGLSPDLGVSTLLTRAVGERRALELLLSDRELDAATARDWGMVAEVSAAPLDRALEIARGWADGPSGALGQAARLVRASATRTFRESLDDEARTIGAAFVGAEASERIAAFAAAAAGGRR
ncbi:enoyl-CoA hydratase/isomerase family protein [Demequina pelophila]|uniref:enoyl-CoA hydratase/isomerase family protein n=1 Tax=Demequina pelophila TaxID=1638984 RepID=UPI0007858116|nr:enoyl-CoA hydratase-related protein [Demequina pelophila]